VHPRAASGLKPNANEKLETSEEVQKDIPTSSEVYNHFDSLGVLNPRRSNHDKLGFIGQAWMPCFPSLRKLSDWGKSRAWRLISPKPPLQKLFLVVALLLKVIG
jgi:hypothetical protein